MSERSKQRLARRATLQLQCAQQRVRLATKLEEARRHLEPIDRALAAIRSLRRAPLLLGGVATVASLIGAALSGRRRQARGSGAAARWAEWIALAAPVLQPLLGMLERWWHARQSAAHPADHSAGERPHPGSP
jgi:hypothetical protein